MIYCRLNNNHLGRLYLIFLLFSFSFPLSSYHHYIQQLIFSLCALNIENLPFQDLYNNGISREWTHMHLVNSSKKCGKLLMHTCKIQRLNARQLLPNSLLELVKLGLHASNLAVNLSLNLLLYPLFNSCHSLLYFPKPL